MGDIFMKDMFPKIHNFFLRAKSKFKMRFGIWRLTEIEINSLENEIQDLCRFWNNLHNSKEKCVKITFKYGWF